MDYQWTTSNRFTHRYQSGECRSTIFRDMVAESLRSFQGETTVLDIGCGDGFDGDQELQASLSGMTTYFLGVEPALDVEMGGFFSQVFQSKFEYAPIAAKSVQVAYCNMVLEHVEDPNLFFDKLRTILSPGGVFWGFTVDSRHVFCKLSAWMQKTRIKNTYLTLLKGERGTDRYMNYPTCYLANSPKQMEPFASGFQPIEFIRFNRPDVLNYYLPRFLTPLSEFWNGRIDSTEQPGYMIAIKLVREAF